MKTLSKLLTCSLLAAMSAISCLANSASPTSQSLQTPVETIVRVRKPLSRSEFEKYMVRRTQLGHAVAEAAAGASGTTEKVVLIVGGAVLVTGVLLLIVTHGGKSALSGSNFSNLGNGT